MKFESTNLTYEGLVPLIQKSFLSKDVDAMQPHIRAFVERVVTFSTCPDCGDTTARIRTCPKRARRAGSRSGSR